jgi:NAD(P)-dependent dehydrogenase (short-subunit alcohol dehydrogenase family)
MSAGPSWRIDKKTEGKKETMDSFTGKTALVTGGSQGIGLATVLRLLREGARVATCGRSTDKWQAALAQHAELAAVDFTPLDTADAEALATWFSHLKQIFGGRLDVAVNNAAGSAQSAKLVDMADADVRRMFDSTLLAPLRCMKEEIALMLPPHGGAIVNVSSINGLRATPGASTYSAAKHGLEGLTKSLALEYAERGIRINAVAPGPILTPRWQARIDAADPSVKLKDQVEAAVPLKRFGSAEEVANAIVWLCSDEASYVLGHTLVVDGGLAQA